MFPLYSDPLLLCSMLSLKIKVTLCMCDKDLFVSNDIDFSHHVSGTTTMKMNVMIFAAQ